MAVVGASPFTVSTRSPTWFRVRIRVRVTVRVRVRIRARARARARVRVRVLGLGSGRPSITHLDSTVPCRLRVRVDFGDNVVCEAEA